jgi:hypothetical protein
MYIKNILRPKIYLIINDLHKDLIDEFHLENIILTFLPHCYTTIKNDKEIFPIFDKTKNESPTDATNQTEQDNSSFNMQICDDFYLLNFIAENLTCGQVNNIKLVTDFYKELRRLKQNQQIRH